MPQGAYLGNRGLGAASAEDGQINSTCKRDNGDQFVPIPNPHRREIGVNLLAEILKEAEVSRKSGFQSNESYSKYDPTILHMPARIVAFDHEGRLHDEQILSQAKRADVWPTWSIFS